MRSVYYFNVVFRQGPKRSTKGEQVPARNKVRSLLNNKRIPLACCLHCGSEQHLLRALSITLLILFSLVPTGLAQSWGQGPPPRHAPIPAGDKPRDLDDVRIDQKLDEALPLDALFRDENGKQVKLGDYFGSKPVVLALVYYSCPMLCNQVLNGMTSGLDVLKTFS